MKFRLLELGGYTDAIARLRMSTGKYYSWEKIRDIQKLAYVLVDERGFIVDKVIYNRKIYTLKDPGKKITGDYETDKAEFERLLELTFNQAMGVNKHHTLMKGIDITFITEGLHRGAQDDLDAHAISFNNRITRFSTRLASIENNELSEWYKDKVIPFHKAHQLLDYTPDEHEVMPSILNVNGEDYHYTPFGYIHKKYADVPAKSGLAKDVQRGGMLLGMPSNAIWKIDLFNLRYVYKMRSGHTKANPELKEGMEQLADQIEEHLPVFGKYFRKERTSTGDWEHMNKTRTVSKDEYREFLKWKNTKELMEHE